jgi:hypothetical protein
MAIGLAAQPKSARLRQRRWRRVLAVLTSLALVLSFVHDWGSFDHDDDILTVAAMQLSGGDVPGKAASDWAAPHGDHALAHATGVAPQESAVPIEYAARPYGFAAATLPEGADPASPFKPPRA